ncbi:Mbeg1-like protein [Lactobacillus psittaci]|uniref:DUF2974 domain-containing protein n=1 Tax=Lactobacillus psittaci DSM 15354 TaxID=1122152 RepID=A0A0R1S9R3_9LACO|nr:Mbeg1-like protein [Lactobacillus psittaci]KRL62947.1 hypothetical protein FC23_GL001131 [Lactobacillus psittaci DSM 15354]
MAGPLEYLRWRGDLNYKVAPFNSVDGAILACVAYLPFDSSTTSHTLKEACERILEHYKAEIDLTKRTEAALITKSPRFGNLEILDWTSRLEEKPTPLQFAALTVKLDENTIVVSFRGTDSSVVGWNEDMIMNYSYQIYGQTVARDYLETISAKYPDKKIYVVGHSKGGHYAIHSLAESKPEVQDRVILAYSYDGPGYRSLVSDSDSFKRALPKMRTYVPEGSVFGIMLDHPERTLVIKSDYPMMHQHSPLKWNIGRDSFVLADGLSTSARVIRHALIQFNKSIPAEKRGQLWSAIFLAFENMDITDMNVFTEHRIKGPWTLGRVVMGLDPEVRHVAIEMIKLIYESAKNNYLPFSEIDFSNYPKSNDSSKAAIFFDSYDFKD